MEFCSSRLLLQLCLFERSFTLKFFKLLSYFLVLTLVMLKVTLPSIEVMLILSAVVTSVILLYYLRLFVEKFTLFILHFSLFLVHELATANIPSPDALCFLCGSLLIIEFPLYLEHSPVLLNYDGSCVFFVTVFFGFI